MSDVGQFDLRCIDLRLSLEAAFSNQWNKDKDGFYRVNAYKKVDGQLILGRAQEGDPGWVIMLAPVTAEEAVPMVKMWLREQDYGREPDIDGSCSKSWRVFNGPWGYAGNDWRGVVAIEPYWAEYHK